MASSSVDGPLYHAASVVDHRESMLLKHSTSFQADTLLYTLSERMLHDALDDEAGGTYPHRLHSLRQPFVVIKDDGSYQAPDGGYGWFVVFGSFLAHMIESSFERGDGIFYLEFIQRFGRSHQLTAMPSSTATSLLFLLSPLASMICNRYSIRASAMMGAIVFSTGIFLTQFATDFPTLFFTYGVLQGTGRAFFSGPGLIIIGLYFKRRQGVATGLATSGVGCGAFLLVPLVQFLFKNYGYEGTFLIFSGVTAHIIFVALLYRPLSLNNKYLAIDARRRLENCVQRCQTEEAEDKSVSHTVDPAIYVRVCFEKEAKRTNAKLQTTILTDSPSNTIAEDKTHCPSQCETANSDKHRSCCLLDNCCCQICFPIEEFNKNHGADSESSRLFQCHLLSYTPYFFYILAVFLFTASFKIVYMFLPTLVLSKGHSIEDAAFIVSVAGPIDTVSRICIGLLVDTSYVRPHRMRVFNCMLISLSVCSLLIPQQDSLVQIAARVTAFATSAGMCFATRTVVLVDLLGIKLLASAFGTLMFFQGFATLIGPQLAGWLFDRFGTVVYGYYLAAGGMAMAAVCMHCSIVWHNRTTETPTGTAQ